MKKIIAVLFCFACILAVAGCDQAHRNLPNRDTSQASTMGSDQNISNDVKNSQMAGSNSTNTNSTDTNSINSNTPQQPATGGYDKLLEDLAADDSEVHYSVKDIDGDGVEDFIMIDNNVLSVYTFDNTVKLVGKYDFVTGTAQYFYSEKDEYPGVFYMFSGGGVDHYGYMTIQNGSLLLTELWKYDRSPFAEDPENPVTELSSDKDLIAESKFLEDNDCDIEFDCFKNK